MSSLLPTYSSFQSGNVSIKPRTAVTLAFGTLFALLFLAGSYHHDTIRAWVQSNDNYNDLGPGEAVFPGLSEVKVDLPWDSPDYPPDQPRIILMQHFSLQDDRVYALQNYSLDQHERYTQYWQYHFHTTKAVYVDPARQVRERQVNKLYALLDLAIQQQSLGERSCEWIYLTDADVLIRNPDVPIHALLPTSPEALIMGTSDGNGFNSGNILYRCGLELIAFLSHAIALSNDMHHAYDAAEANGVDVSLSEDSPFEPPPSDQRAICLILQNYPYFSSRFYAYPEQWLNRYLPDVEPMQLNSHLVAGSKYMSEEELLPLLHSEREGWQRLHEMGEGEKEVWVQLVKGRAEEHWRGVKPGPPSCIWM